MHHYFKKYLNQLIPLFLIFSLMSVSHAAYFANLEGQITYDILYTLADNPEEVLEGKFYLEILSKEENEKSTTLHCRQYSTIFPRYKLFDIIETETEVYINGVTYIGPGSDQIDQQYLFLKKKLTINDRVINDLISLHVKSSEIRTISQRPYEIYELDIIATYDQFYTFVGTHWVTDSLGIVESSFITDGGHHIILKRSFE